MVSKRTETGLDRAMIMSKGPAEKYRNELNQSTNSNFSKVSNFISKAYSVTPGRPNPDNHSQNPNEPNESTKVKPAEEVLVQET
jgi:hypothetical protein